MASYSREAQQISKIAWYYETKYGLEVITDPRNFHSMRGGTPVNIIPWRKVAASLKRHRTAATEE